MLAPRIATPVEAIGNVFDKLFTSEEERLQAGAVLEKSKQHPAALQVALNRRRRITRPSLPLGCGRGLDLRRRVGWAYIGHPLFLWAAALWSPGLAPPAIHTDSLFELALAMLGMAGLRSLEKAAG